MSDAAEVGKCGRYGAQRQSAKFLIHSVSSCRKMRKISYSPTPVGVERTQLDGDEDYCSQNGYETSTSSLEVGVEP